MQKICIGILTALFVIIFAINVTAWDYYPINEWNFNYEKTYEEAFDDNSTVSTELYDED